MFVFIIVGFIAGGLCGMVGMAILAYGSKNTVNSEVDILYRRLNFLENESEKKRFKPVQDPRPRVHKLVN